jgi:hypothetical protein
MGSCVRCGAVGHGELAEDVCDVHAGGLVTDEEAAGDLAVGQSVGEEREHFDLAGCQFELLQRGDRRLGGKVALLQIDVGSTCERLQLLEHAPQELEKLTSNAGFRDVEARSRALTLELPGPAEFLWQYVHSTPLAGFLAQLDDAGRAALERDVVAGWWSFVKDGTLAEDVNVVLTTARK